MQRILIPVSAANDALPALKYAIAEAAIEQATECHLLHIQPTLPLGISAYRTQKEIEALEALEAEHALRDACAMLAAAHVPYVAVFRNGPVATAIAAYAKAFQCDGIVMGTRGRGISTLVKSATAAKVRRLVRIPVRLVK